MVEDEISRFDRDGVAREVGTSMVYSDQKEQKGSRARPHLYSKMFCYLTLVTRNNDAIVDVPEAPLAVVSSLHLLELL
jgi:hypothetical protein